MKHAKPVAVSPHPPSRPGPRTFVPAAWFAMVLVLLTVQIILVALGFAFHSSASLALGFIVCSLLPAVILGVIIQVPRWLWSKCPNMVHRSECFPATHSSVRDDWLDGPS
jgi:hypothetical protein